MELLNEIIIIFINAIAVLFICTRLKIPAIVGYLITGTLLGPYGLKVIQAIHEVEILAEIGVVLLLFTIGIEFSFKNLLQIRKTLLVGGTAQVLLTFAATYFIVKQFGFTSEQAIFMGFLFSLSSTAIVLKTLQERAEVDSPYGQATLGILIFQDLVIVPMMLITPMLTKNPAMAAAAPSLMTLAGKIILVIIGVILSAKFFVPQIFYQVTKTKNQELFLLSVIVTCFIIAFATSKAGLSPALGAFLAGLIISESEYSHQALSNILPFKSIFTSFFFVSIGMLLNLGFLYAHLNTVILSTINVLFAKFLLAGISALLLGLSLRSSVLAGLALSQIGEFSFVLSKTGLNYGLLDEMTYQYFLSISVLTMISTPFLLAAGPLIADIISKLPLPERIKTGLYPHEKLEQSEAENHLIITGFGINGKNLARACKLNNISYVITEMNPKTVIDEKKAGEPIFYGDATCEPVLMHVNIKTAKIMAITIADRIAARGIIELARRLNPNIYIIARTRFYSEIDQLLKLGANEVVSEEFESSIELFGRVLNKCLVPKKEIEQMIGGLKSDGYEMMKKNMEYSISLSDVKMHFNDFEVTSLRLEADSKVIGKSLMDIALRKKHELTLLGIKRGEETIANPGAEIVFATGDTLILAGKREKLNMSGEIF